ncbi:MAG: PSP1 domain-containing protein [Armatimonadota bacterium]
MPIVVGVSLRTAGKIYYFDPGTEPYDRDERVLVETARGLELGCVKQSPHEVSDEQIVPPLKSVVRRANTDDLARDAFNRERETTALESCKRLVGKLNLPMRLIDAQYTFDGSHVLIHFLADNRVDFRELVRELAHELHTRIELRQVGVRDEAKLLGGYGICGRQLCCSAFLANFVPVAINTAKEQGLALNPQKISGMCGRLMCCLAFEHECYREVGKGLPRMNSIVATPRGSGKVTKLSVLARQVEVSIPDMPGPLWFPVDELNLAAPAEHAAAGGCGGCCAHAKEATLEDVQVVPQVTEPPRIAVSGNGDDEPAGPEEPHRRSRRRRRRSGAPAGLPQAGQPQPAPRQAASQRPEPANGPAQPQGSSRPRRRRPRNQGEANPSVPFAAQAAPQGGAAPQAANPEGAGHRRRRRRR